ncbi:MAG: hypothetical protein EOO60_01980 [Hymenobacter sp.]|nr:MAG: hypothetical protein EOO60_01980 [Hymenobacter sp.]
MASPAAAQRPTAEAAKPAVSFWPINYPTGTVVFTAPTARPLASALIQAECLRAWLTSICSTWTELQTQADSTQLYQGQLRGVHAGVALRFAVQVRREQTGWQYNLLAFRVRSPTGNPDLVHWLPLERLLDDRDFGPDIMSFRQQLQQALPRLGK